MKIIKTKRFPFGQYKAINLFGVVFTRENLSETEINHEAIHTAQMKEMLYIFFYLWYAIEYVIIWFKHNGWNQNRRYKNLRFEQEAYEYENNLAYLNQRKRYNWIKYGI